MAENLTVARPYAQAAFEVALKQQALDKWQQMLYAMSVACSDADFLSSLKNASSSSVASERLLEVLKDLLDEYGQNFVKALGEKFRFLKFTVNSLNFARCMKKLWKFPLFQLVNLMRLHLMPLSRK